jgi:hypothetical protein
VYRFFDRTVAGHTLEQSRHGSCPSLRPKRAAHKLELVGNWLSTVGAKQPKESYQERLAALKNWGNPVHNRDELWVGSSVGRVGSGHKF